MVEFKHILCPVDLSEQSIRPLAYAGALARWYAGRLTVLHVVPTFDPMEIRSGALFDPVRLVYPIPREEVLEHLRRALTSAGIAADDVALVAEAGEAAETIVDQSLAVRSDLLVMGTHGRSGFNRLLLGSITEKVLHRAPCPVLTVPPHASAAPGVALRHILCPTDFSPAAMQAFGFALELARRTEASLTVLHAIEWLPEEDPRELAHFNVPEYRRHLTDGAHQRLKALVADAPSLQRGVHDVVVTGRAHWEILRVAQEAAADLIVMGAQGRGGPALTMFGSTTQQVVRAAGCPVLTVRGTR